MVYAYGSEPYVARLGSSSLPVPTAMKKLETVTLLGIDCVDIDRLILAADICMEQFEFAEVKLLTSLPSEDKRVVPIEPISSIEAYSKFCIADLNKYVDTPHVLLFQYDGFILNPAAWSRGFLDYDYIGAPWIFSDWSVKKFDMPTECLGKKVVGNGGFSLRSKKLLSLCEKLDGEGAFESYHPEDMIICYWKRELLERAGMKFPSFEVARQFSYEGKDGIDNKWNGQFGFHGFRWTDVSNWTKDHLEYVVSMKEGTLRKLRLPL